MAQKNKKFSKHQMAKKVGIQPYMMAAWENQFDITPDVKNGEAIYSRQHLSRFKVIKELLYEKDCSMDAVKKYLKDNVHLEGTTLMAASPLLFDNQRQEALKELIGPAIVEQVTPQQKDPQLQVQAPQEDLSYKKEVKTKLLAIKERLLKISQSL